MLANIAGFLLAMSEPCCQAVLMDIADGSRAFARVKEGLVRLRWRAADPACVLFFGFMHERKPSVQLRTKLAFYVDD